MNKRLSFLGTATLIWLVIFIGTVVVFSARDAASHQTDTSSPSIIEGTMPCDAGFGSSGRSCPVGTRPVGGHYVEPSDEIPIPFFWFFPLFFYVSILSPFLALEELIQPSTIGIERAGTLITLTLFSPEVFIPICWLLLRRGSKWVKEKKNRQIPQ